MSPNTFQNELDPWNPVAALRIWDYNAGKLLRLLQQPLLHVCPALMTSPTHNGLSTSPPFWAGGIRVVLRLARELYTEAEEPTELFGNTVYLSVYLPVYIHTCIHAYICTHMHTGIHASTNIYIYIQIYIDPNIR